MLRSLLRFGVTVVCAIMPLSLTYAQQVQVQGVTDKEIVIGAFGPITGPLSWLGQGARDGIQLAIDEINVNGGINGRNLRLEHQPATTPAESLAAVKKLNEQSKVYMIFSAHGSTGAEAAADYFRESGMPVFNCVSLTMRLREPFASNIFNGTPPSVDIMNKAYVESILGQKPTPKRIAVLVGTYAFPQAEWNGAKPLFEKAGLEIATVQSYDLGDRDYTAQLAQISRAKPDLVVAFGQVQEIAIAIRQAPERGLAKTPWWVGAGVVTKAFPTVAGKASEGTRSVWALPYFHGEKSNPMEKFEAAWTKRFGQPPEGRPAYTDVFCNGDMNIVALAMRNAGSDLSWPNLVRQFEALKNAKPSDLGPWAHDVVFPETFGPGQRQGNSKSVDIVVKDGTWQVLRDAQ
ncbi:ABC transporter substrate-binding protein [Tardiphaga robiniae]|nr:ABC transporter substrate-binding protein [Tardiphaga robiniae]